MGCLVGKFLLVRLKRTNGTVSKILKDGGDATVYRIYLYLLF